MSYPDPNETSKLYMSFIKMIEQFEKETGTDSRDTTNHPLEADLQGWLIKTFPNMDTAARTELQEYAVNNRAYWRIDPTQHS